MKRFSTFPYSLEYVSELSGVEDLEVVKDGCKRVLRGWNHMVKLVESGKNDKVQYFPFIAERNDIIVVGTYHCPMSLLFGSYKEGCRQPGFRNEDKHVRRGFNYTQWDGVVGTSRVLDTAWNLLTKGI